MSSGDSYRYDVFISYSLGDQQWVWHWLLPRLERAQIRVCIEDRDFQHGAPKISEIERAVLQSRKTLLILSPGYLASEWAEYGSILVQTIDPAARARRLLPLLRQPCELPLRLRMLQPLDLTSPDPDQALLQQLIATLQPSAAPLPVPSVQPQHQAAVGPATAVATEPATQIDRPTLRENLSTSFSLDELRTLCFDLEIDFDSLGGEGKDGKARELLAYCQRQRRIDDLLNLCRRHRPRVRW